MAKSHELNASQAEVISNELRLEKHNVEFAGAYARIAFGCFGSEACVRRCI